MIATKKNKIVVNMTQKEKDLWWTNSLRQILPPTGDLTHWKFLSPEACKLYLLIWGLDSINWKPPMPEAFDGVHSFGIELYSGLKPKALHKALQELKEMQLIKESIEIGYCAYKLIYHAPPHVIENGV